MQPNTDKQLKAQNNGPHVWYLMYLFVFLCTPVVDFVLKDPREKDDDKKEEVLEHKLE